MTHETSTGNTSIRKSLFMVWFGLLVWFDLQTTMILLGDITDPRTRLYVMIKSMIILLVFLYVLRVIEYD